MKVNTLREWRAYVMARDKHTCQVCGYNCGRIEAHHIVPKFADKRFILETNNGISLCRLCHLNAHATKNSVVRNIGRLPDLSDYEPGDDRY